MPRKKNIGERNVIELVDDVRRRQINNSSGNGMAMPELPEAVDNDVVLDELLVANSDICLHCHMQLFSSSILLLCAQTRMISF